MLIIRLQRLGRRNEPTFRIVLTDSKNSTKSGKFLEILGSYDARDKNETKVNAERVKELISEGAQLSDTVRNFLIDQKVIEGRKVNVLPKKSPVGKKKGGEAEETAEAGKAEPAKNESTPAPASETTLEPEPEPNPEVAPAPATEEKSVEEAPEEEESQKEQKTPEKAPAE